MPTNGSALFRATVKISGGAFLPQTHRPGCLMLTLEPNAIRHLSSGYMQRMHDTRGAWDPVSVSR